MGAEAVVAFLAASEIDADALRERGDPSRSEGPHHGLAHRGVVRRVDDDDGVVVGSVSARHHALGRGPGLRVSDRGEHVRVARDHPEIARLAVVQRVVFAEIPVADMGVVSRRLRNRVQVHADQFTGMSAAWGSRSRTSTPAGLTARSLNDRAGAHPPINRCYLRERV